MSQKNIGMKKKTFQIYFPIALMRGKSDIMSYYSA